MRWMKSSRFAKDLQKPKYVGDAGFDLAYCGLGTLSIRPGSRVNIQSCISVELPAGTWGLIVGRSSTFQNGLLINPGVVHNGWRSDLLVCGYNYTSKPIHIDPGDRVGQLIPLPLLMPAIGLEEVDVLLPSDRAVKDAGR